MPRHLARIGPQRGRRDGTAELAAAVSEAGGLGMIETLTDEGRTDLRRVRELTDKPGAANLMIQEWKKDPSIVDALADAKVRHVFTSAGTGSPIDP